MYGNLPPKIFVEKFEIKHVYQLVGVAIVITILIMLGKIMYYFMEGPKTTNVLKNYQKKTTQVLREFTSKDCEETYKDKYLSDFYIASSAMSFLVDKQRYDYVNIEMIKNCLIMGARYIELEVINDSFSMNARPIVTTGYQQGQWQTSLNNIDFEECCNVIASYAFEPTIKTHSYPLFLYLKLKVDNYAPTLSKMAKIIKKYFPSKKEKIMESGNRIDTNINPAETKICNLFNQIVIWADPIQTDELGDDDKKLIKEFTDTTNKYPPIRLHYTKLTEYIYSKPSDKPKTPADYRDESDILTNHNRKKLTIVYPHEETDVTTINFGPEEAWSYGCQFVLMNYQLDDDNRKLYFDKFKIDSIVEKPLILQRDPPKEKIISIDGLVPDSKEQSDYLKRQLAFLFKNQPIYLRPYNDPSKVITIDNSENLIIQEKRDNEIDIEDTFLISPTLSNPDNNLMVSLESTRYPNKYIFYNGNEFNIEDWRKHQFSGDTKEFARSATFIPMKPFAQTRSNVKEDTTNMVSFYIQDSPNSSSSSPTSYTMKNIITYNITSQLLEVEEDDEQNFQLANRGSFIIYKLPVKVYTNFRQTNGMYIHAEGKMLVSKKIDLSPNGVFEIIEEKNIGNFPSAKMNFVHIKDNNGNFWSVDESVIRSNKKIPDEYSRFIIENNRGTVKIIFGGDNRKAPIIVQKDGVVRMAYSNELDSPRTNFIMGNSYKKI
jgi:hypothetical protein